MTDNYRVVASTPSRHAYPLYKYHNSPKEWNCNGSVVISCQDGKVDVKIFEKDSINIHHLEVWSDDGPVGARLTEQLDPVQE
jgi:hypothetical protein|tara:strand:- start:454 stop:699 length:246 start_codon:yes stop_codon:yes gene_type:complete